MSAMTPSRLTEEELTAIDMRAEDALTGTHRLTSLVPMNQRLARDVQRLLAVVRSSEDAPQRLSATG